MSILTRLGAIVALQAAQAAAANGSVLDITDASTVVVEVSGTYTAITANFEASIDAGTTWFGVSLATLASTTQARVAAATATGLYRLENANGLNAFRARTTVSSPTGSMTVRVVSAT